MKQVPYWGPTTISTVPNLVATATWDPRFVYTYCKFRNVCIALLLIISKAANALYWIKNHNSSCSKHLQFRPKKKISELPWRYARKCSRSSFKAVVKTARCKSKLKCLNIFSTFFNIKFLTSLFGGSRVGTFVKRMPRRHSDVPRHLTLHALDDTSVNQWECSPLMRLLSTMTKLKSYCIPPMCHRKTSEKKTCYDSTLHYDLKTYQLRIERPALYISFVGTTITTDL